MFKYKIVDWSVVTSIFYKKKMCIIYSTAVFRANAVKDNISLGSVDKRENSISSLILFSEIENIV